ncbi:MAG: hypothetical protein UW09_C0004G0121 [candidate division TM6 bacterium GW2011_GWF2_43_87]|nr:MAG: hypothetical protein UW09_C0004G0121 [candidate division TM6 bacterium GW2011_GWF2_43_87]
MEKFFMNKKLNCVVMALLLGVFAGSVEATNNQNAQADKDFLRAIADRNCGAAAQALNNGAKIDGTGDWTPLHYAALHGWGVNVVQFLIDNGANVNQINNNDDTPLSLAFELGHVDIVRCLVEAGADINQTDKVGWSLLHYAAFNGWDFACFNYLVSKGADIQKISDDNDSPLSCAFQSGYLDAARCLIKAGASINVIAPDGSNLLHRAAYDNWNVKSVKYLIEQGVAIDKVNNNNETPLLLAAQRGHLDVVRCLVEAGASFSIKNTAGQTARDLAVQGIHPLVVSYLDNPFLKLYRAKAFVKRHKFSLTATATLATVGVRWWYARRHGLSFVPSFFSRRGFFSVSKMTPVQIAPRTQFCL